MVAALSNVEPRFRYFRELADGDTTAAAVLVLAESMNEKTAAPALKVAEAAARLSVSQATVYDLINSGRLPSHRIGGGRGTLRIRAADLQAFQSCAISDGESENPASVTLTMIREAAKPRASRRRRREA